MHERDKEKVMAAGFTLYRCSEAEKMIKRRTAGDMTWKNWAKCKTKKEVRMVHLRLLEEPHIIQD